MAPFSYYEIGISLKKEFIMRGIKTIIGLILISSIAMAQTAADSAGIQTTALNYIEGWYTADGGRMHAALHPQLAKRRIVSASEIWEVSAEWMIDRTGQGQGYSPPGDRFIKITILDIHGDRATVKVESNNFFDYLHVVKFGEVWKIVNVLWEYYPTGTAELLSGTEATVQSYINHLYQGNSSHLSNCVDSRLAARKPVSATEVDHMSYNDLVQAVQNTIWSGSTQDVKVTVLDVDYTMSCAKLETPHGVEYVHLAYYSNAWKVVNILWERSSNPTGINSMPGSSAHCPQKIELGQNYPNPFNPSTQISYSLQEPLFIHLNIYNLQGQRVRTLLEEFQHAGQHRTSWDGRDNSGLPVASGVYVYELASDLSRIQKKMTFIE